MNKKLVLVISVISLAVAFSLFLLAKNEPGTFEYDSNSSQLSDKETKTSASQKENTASVEEDIFSPENLEIINSWRVANGSRSTITFVDGFPTEGPAPQRATSYQGYDLELLKELAGTDDAALLELGNRLFEANDFDQAEQYLKEGAVRGYAQPMMDLVIGNARRGRKVYLQARNSGLLENPDPENETASQAVKDEIDRTFVESLAWLRVVDLIHLDPPPPLSDNDTFDLEDRFGVEHKDFLLSRALPRAEAILSELRSKRSQIGLGDFESDMPPQVQQFFRIVR